MSDTCETKHSFSAVCDMKEGSQFRIPPPSPPPPLARPSLFTARVIVSSSVRWLHVEGWCIDHRQSFDSSVLQNTDNLCSKVNGLSPAHKGHSFISSSHTGQESAFFPDNKMPLKYIVYKAHPEKTALVITIVFTCHWYSSRCVFRCFCFFDVHYCLFTSMIQTSISSIFHDIIYTCPACSTNTVWFLCTECMCMLCQGLL